MIDNIFSTSTYKVLSIIQVFALKDLWISTTFLKRSCQCEQDFHSPPLSFPLSFVGRADIHTLLSPFFLLSFFCLLLLPMRLCSLHKINSLVSAGRRKEEGPYYLRSHYIVTFSSFSTGASLHVQILENCLSVRPKDQNQSQLHFYLRGSRQSPDKVGRTGSAGTRQKLLTYIWQEV